MQNPNQMRNDVLAMQKKAERELGNLTKSYEVFFSELHKRLQEEYRATGSLSGLEDFYRFNQVVKRNKTIVLNAYTAVSRLKDIEGFDISEEEAVESKKPELEKKK